MERKVSLLYPHVHEYIRWTNNKDASNYTMIPNIDPVKPIPLYRSNITKYKELNIN